MKMSEIREMTDPELEHMARELQQERLTLNIQSRTGQLQNPARIRQIRRDVARIRTEQTVRSAKQTQ